MRKVKGFRLIVLCAILAALLVPPLAVTGEDTPVEIVDLRTRTSKTYSLGADRYALDLSIGSVHYKDDLADPYELWKDIDTAIVPSARPAWDWEVVKGNWHLLIRQDTTVALGKAGHWIGFKYAGFGYLDWSTKEYVVLRVRNAVSPVVTDNKITWPDIFDGVTLEYVYTPDGFKENLYISQAARDWLVANPPSSYGLSNPTTYLVGGLECDWLNAYPAEDAYGTAINWNNANEFIDKGVFWRQPVLNKVVTALPLGYAFHDDIALDEPVKLRYRFYEQGGKHYLLYGARVLDLNAYPAGTIVLDPTIDEQVGANLDDVDEYEATGTVTDRATDVRHQASTSEYGRYWGAHRWTGITGITAGDTIDVCYVTFDVTSTDYDDANFNMHFEELAAPPTFTTGGGGDVTSRDRTETSVAFIKDGCGTGAEQSPELKTALQEVVDTYTPTTIVLICRPNSDTAKSFFTTPHNDTPSSAAELHIEYTAAAAAGYSYGTIIG